VIEKSMTHDPLISFTRSLVRCPSRFGEEEAVVSLILTQMTELGFDRVWRDANGSAIGIIEGKLPGPTLLLDGHCDTVGIAPGITWPHDPFGAQIEGGFIYGRGTADMKGALTAMIYAAASLDRARLRGRVVVSATVMEENLEGAALKDVMDALRPDFVVIGEATDLKLNRGGRGRAEIHLETIGRPAHSSTPHLGRNAVHDMLRVVAAIEQLPTPNDPLLGRGILALTDIISDPYPAYSVIPSRCRVTYDRRLLPGETERELLGAITDMPELAGIELRAAIAQGEHTTYTGAMLRGPKFLPAFSFSEDHAFVQTAARGLRSVGLDPQMGAYRFCTNAAYSAGVAGVPTIGFGPGREEDAHVIDERIAVADVLAAERGYRGIIEATLS
jgi:putative selenium metabolism hydrolase